MIQKAIGFLVVFILFPVCMGLLWMPGMNRKKYRIDQIYLSGFLTELAVFQLIAVPVMILKAHGMEILVILTNVICGFLSAAGVGIALVCRKKEGAGLKAAATNLKGLGADLKAGFASLSWECWLFWLLAGAAVLFQMYMSFDRASFDGDDAYYVVQSVLADQTGVLNRIKPYTGLSTDLDIRHALATLPLWEAYVARMTGIHAAIVAHTLLPLILIPLTYLAYFEVGRKLFEEKNVKLPIFIVLVSIMQIWGNSSIYTNATFFLTRTWQGKSIMANLVLLVILWLLLEILDDKKRGYVALLVVSNIVAAMMTSMGAFLAAMFIGIAGLIAAVRQKKLSVLVKLALCCIPNVIYLLMLLVL